MRLGIRPIIDFAFKKTFGDPNNRLALISLLNAILELPIPILDVKIENPFQYQDFLDDKLSILDVKATDLAGTIFHIEMQLSVTTGLTKRLVFYGCELYAGQLSQGEDYTCLRPVYSISILNEFLFGQEAAGHHRFRLADIENKRVLENTFEIHLLELPRYTLSEADLCRATPVERWVFLLRYAQDYDAQTLRKLFPEVGFSQAIDTFETISLKTEDRQMYDTRDKAARDRLWLMNGAIKEAENKGREEGKLTGIIQTCRSILGMSDMGQEVFDRTSVEELRTMASELQALVRGRSSGK